jgi:hypothetical protein
MLARIARHSGPKPRGPVRVGTPNKRIKLARRGAGVLTDGHEVRRAGPGGCEES